MIINRVGKRLGLSNCIQTSDLEFGPIQKILKVFLSQFIDYATKP
jgi:hypothetical protein